jgi:hypothetical protein
MKVYKLMFLLTIAILISCEKDSFDFNNNECIDGSGMVVTESRDLGNFHSILNTVYADILITQGPVEDIIIEAQSNILEELETSVQNGQLIVETDRCIDIDQAIKIFITIPEIRKLSLIGVGDFIAENEFNIDDLEVLISGSGNVSLKGEATTLDITLTGVGDVRAYDMTVNICNVVITGVGNVEVFVNDKLDVTISGVGSVYYRGNPIVNSTITGTGNVVNDN